MSRPAVPMTLALLLAALPHFVAAQPQPVEGQPLPGPVDDAALAPEMAPIPEPPPGPLPGQTRVAVVAFESPPSVDLDYQIGPGLADMLITALVNQHRFWVAERAQFESVLREQDLGLEGMVDVTTAARASQAVGAEYLVMGKVTNFGFADRSAGIGALGGGLLGRLGGVKGNKRKAQVAVDVRLVDATTGRVVLSKRASGESTDGGGFALGGDPQGLVGVLSVKSEEWENSMLGRACGKAIENLVKLVVDYFPFACRVIAVSDGYVYVDAGKFAGIAPGREFQVVREKHVTDSQGNVVFTETTELGRITVVDVTNETSKAKIEAGAGDIQEGDKATDPEETAQGKEKGKKKGGRG